MAMTMRYQARRLVNFLVGLIPRPCLRVFLRSFETRADLAERAGYHVYPRLFYSPLPLLEEIDWEQLRNRRELRGIDLNPEPPLRLLNNLRQFTPELETIPARQTGETFFWFDNGGFGGFDAAALYAMLRYLKPKRYVELGCGFSSFISSRALKRNQQEGHDCDAIYADPEPRLDMQQILAHGRLMQKRVQDVPMEIFQALESGDVLFIDTSHVLKVQSDVTRELVQILPALKPGVWIHVHDIFTPYDYPEEWITKPIRLSCNEQYALECLLSGGDRYRVELPLFMLWKENPEALQAFFPRGQQRPHSFWITKQHL